MWNTVSPHKYSFGIKSSQNNEILPTTTKLDENEMKIFFGHHDKVFRILLPYLGSTHLLSYTCFKYFSCKFAQNKHVHIALCKYCFEAFLIVLQKPTKNSKSIHFKAWKCEHGQRHIRRFMNENGTILFLLTMILYISEFALSVLEKIRLHILCYSQLKTSKYQECGSSG